MRWIGWLLGLTGLAWVLWMALRKKESENGVTVIQLGGDTRGWRNKNVLNVRWNAANDWQGQTGSDPVFCVFSNYEDGLRAAVKIIAKYWSDYNLRTVAQVLGRYAPDGDAYNDPAGYLRAVKELVGLEASDVLDTTYKAAKLVKAMAYVESRAGLDMDSACNVVRRYCGGSFVGGS